MSFSKATADEIKDVLLDCVTRTFERIAKKEKEDKLKKPFHIALLASDFVRISSFERSFSTSFGQGAIEKLSKLVAESNGFQAERQKAHMVNVFKGAQDEIGDICTRLRGGEIAPNWKREVERVRAHNLGETVVRRVISDLFLTDPDGRSYHFSIKTVLPNLDQAEKAKSDMLFMVAHSEDITSFFGLYYNPHGDTRADYKHSFTNKIFNPQKDKCVLIGKDYWDFLGGDGSYEELLRLFSEVGETTRKRLLPKA